MFGRARALASFAAGPCGEFGDELLFATWEASGVRSWSDPARPEFAGDGGTRLIRQRGGGRTEEIVEVGTGPGRMARLRTRSEVRERSRTWRSVVADLVRDLAEAAEVWEDARSEAAALVAGFLDLPVHCTMSMHVRSRAWSTRAGEAASECVSSAALRIEVGEGARRIVKSRLFETTEGPSAATAWAASLAPRMRRRIDDQRRAARQRARPGRWIGPVVFAPDAAALLAHEFGHAALEAANAPEGRAAREAQPANGPSVVDDPRVAPWPAGFTVDDEGRPARAVALWDAAGRTDVEPGDLARRRGAFGLPAIPSLSATWLAVSGPRSAHALPPEGVPVVFDLQRARFDPVSRRILASAGTVGRFEAGVPVPAWSSATLVIDPDVAWTGVFATDPASPVTRDLARCSRLGSLVAVMVGAPTIGLDPVHVDFGEPAPCSR